MIEKLKDVAEMIWRAIVRALGGGGPGDPKPPK